MRHSASSPHMTQSTLFIPPDEQQHGQMMYDAPQYMDLAQQQPVRGNQQNYVCFILNILLVTYCENIHDVK